MTPTGREFYGEVARVSALADPDRPELSVTSGTQRLVRLEAASREADVAWRTGDIRRVTQAYQVLKGCA